VSTEA